MADAVNPDQVGKQKTKLEEVLEKLTLLADNPLHKRLIQAYKGSDPKNAVVTEFSQSVSEVARGET